MKLLRSEAGLAMPLVLTIMLVVALLSTALWQYGISELNISLRDEKRSRAYYIARAGAESVALDLMRTPNNVIDLDLDVNESTTTDLIDFRDEDDQVVGQVQVEVERLSDFSIKIHGVGTVNDTIQKVAIVMEALEPFDGVVYSYNDVNFQQQVDVIGDIVSGGNIYWQNTLIDEHPKADEGYTVTSGKELFFPEPVFPDPPSMYTENNFVVSEEEVIKHGQFPDPDQENGYLITNKGYKAVDISGSGKLLIDATTGPVTVYAKNFLMDNNAELELKTSSANKLIISVENDMVLRKVRVTGNGVAYIYLKSGELNAQTPHANILDAGAHLVVYLGEGSLMNVQASGQSGYFQGLVYGPGATVQLQGNANFIGSMIVNRVKGSGERVQADEVHQDYYWDILDDIFGRYHMIQWVSQ